MCSLTSRMLWVVFVVALLPACARSGTESATDRSAYGRGVDEIQRVPTDELDDEYVEGWRRRTDEPRFRAVEAYRSDDGDWAIVVSVAEFLREEPLETELREGVAAAIRTVPGVEGVHHEDREIWIAAGNPGGRALVKAVATFIDELAPRARAAIEAGR